MMTKKEKKEPPEEKKPDAKRILKKLREKYPTINMGRADEVLHKLEPIKTPFPTLNVLIAGGFPRGHFTTLAGPERTGKGTLVLQTIAYQQAQNEDFLALYTDAENGLGEDWLEALGVDRSRLLVQKYGDDGARSMEALLDAGIEICTELKIDMWIIDSIAALLPKTELQTLEKGKMLDLQRKMGEFYRKSNVLLPKKTAVILIGQVYTVPTANVALEEVRGGNAVKHWAHLRIKTRRMARTEAPEEARDVVCPDGKKRRIMPGWACQIKVEKTRVNEKEGWAIKLPFFLGRGFSSSHAILSAALGRGLITRSGPFYNYKDQRFKGRKELEKYFEDQENLDLLAVELENENEDRNDSETEAPEPSEPVRDDGGRDPGLL